MMLTALRRLLRPEPPILPAAHTGLLVTTPEYRLAVRRRAIESMTERRAALAELAHVQAVRARIQATKAAIDERECIRSSRFIKEKGDK